MKDLFRSGFTLIELLVVIAVSDRSEVGSLIRNVMKTIQLACIVHAALTIMTFHSPTAWAAPA